MPRRISAGGRRLPEALLARQRVDVAKQRIAWTVIGNSNLIRVFEKPRPHIRTRRH